MARNLNADLLLLQEIRDLAQGRDFKKAVALARAALAEGFEHPLLLNVAAVKLEQEGRVLEAVGLLSRAVELAPADVGARNALGLCLSRLERHAEALGHFQTLLRLNPGFPFAHANCGGALYALGALPAAEASYRRALELDPAQIVAMAGLASIASRRGMHREARTWSERVLATVPNYPDAAMSLAEAELAEGVPGNAEARIRSLLAEPQVAPLDRAYAHGLLGDALDMQDRPAEAFSAYESCNEELRHLYAARFAEGQTALEYVRSITVFFASARPEDWSPRPVGSDPSGVQGHVFLLGFPRSGTTLLEIILEGHPAVVSLEENESLIDGVRAFMRSPADLERLSRASAAELAPLRAAYWKRVADTGIEVAGKMFVDKYPLNTLKLPLIARLFPDAKILIARRDPRDVVLSCFRRRFRMSAPMYELLSLAGAAHYYDAVMRIAERLDAVLTLASRVVRHETLVTDFDTEIKSICAFLGLEWTATMGDFAVRTESRGSVTPSTAQLARGLETAGLGQWRRYRAQLAPVLPLLDPWVERFSYEP
ncbi:MAG TPA: sulfotransferase [Steroidobacteraceae bacterium]|nr:sulfotransferase [Steroidobacteraceae bacterium]